MARRPALAFILLAVALDSIGFGIVIPVLPDLIADLGHTDIEGAAGISGWLMFGYAVMQFFFGPVMGGLSDQFGRRPVLLASLAAFGLDYIAMGLAPTLAWLVVARLVAGVTGASFTAAYAYIADITPAEGRAAAFGRTGLAFGLGFILGPAIGGLLAEYGTRVPFFAAGGLAIANVLYGLFVLPESLPREKRRAFDWRRANPIGTLMQLRRAQPAVLVMAATVMLWIIGHMSLQAVWSFYTIDRFGWTAREVGYSLTAVGVSSMVVQGWLLGKLAPRFGEVRLVRWGMVSGIAGYLVYGLAAEGWWMYAGIVVFALSGLVYPSLQGLMSGLTAHTEQGELQGAIASLFGLASIVAPPLMTQTFAAFAAADAPVHVPGAPYLLAALLVAAAWLVFARAVRMGVAPESG